MDDIKFDDFCNDLLTAFLDRLDTNELAKTCLKHGTEIGSDIFNKAVNQAVEWVDIGEYDSLNDENRERLKAVFINNLIQKYGAELGQDISINSDGGLIMSDELMTRISADLPEGTIEQMKAQGMLQNITQNPYELLEKQLGIKFFDSLLSVAKLRVETLNDIEVGTYLTALLSGIERRHPWLKQDNFFLSCVVHLCGERLDAVVKSGENLTDSSDAIVHTLNDLLTALGRLDRIHHPETGDLLISREDLLALDKVWIGEKMRFGEIADTVRKFEEKNQK